MLVKSATSFVQGEEAVTATPIIWRQGPRIFSKTQKWSEALSSFPDYNIGNLGYYRLFVNRDLNLHDISLKLVV